MELPEVECVFDTSRSIYCLKPKGSHVGLSGDEIEEVARRCNSYEKYKKALEEIAELETDCCSRCEGGGRLWADGKAHNQSEQVDTILCGNCGGSGRILPEDAQIIASEALKEAEKQCPPVK